MTDAPRPAIISCRPNSILEQTIESLDILPLSTCREPRLAAHTPPTFNSALIRGWLANQPASRARRVRPENAPAVHSHWQHNPNAVNHSNLRI